MSDDIAPAGLLRQSQYPLSLQTLAQTGASVAGQKFVHSGVIVAGRCQFGNTRSEGGIIEVGEQGIVIELIEQGLIFGRLGLRLYRGLQLKRAQVKGALGCSVFGTLLDTLLGTLGSGGPCGTGQQQRRQQQCEQDSAHCRPTCSFLS